MELTLQTFLLLLRNLVTFFRKRWNQSTRRLWYIFAFLRSRFSSRHPKKRGENRRSTEFRPVKPSPTASAVICASRMPTSGPLSPIVGGNTPVIASPTPISIQVRQPTILNSEDSPDEYHENNTGHLDVDGSFLGGSKPFSRLPDFPGYQDEPDPIHTVLPPNREELTSNPPVASSRPIPGPSSYRPPSHNAGYRPWSQYSHHQSEDYSFRSPLHPTGAEAAARGYIPRTPSPRPPSLAQSARPPSIAGSVVSHVYHASKRAGRVRRPSPMSNAPRLRNRSRTPASVRQGVHEAPPDVHVPEPPQPESTGSVHRDRNSAVVGFGPLPQPEGRLRPMIEIDRYGKHEKVTVEDKINEVICPPVTTHFPRWIFPFFPEVHQLCPYPNFQGVSS